MKLKFLFLLMSLSCLLFSCEEDLVQPQQVNESAIGIANAQIINSVDSYRSNLLVEGRFEPTADPFLVQTGTSYGFDVSSNRSRNGSNAARFEIRNEANQIRSEISLAGETQSERWYGNSLYLPANDWDSDLNPDGWDIITQWHAREDKGEDARFPPIALVVSKGRLSLVVYWATQADNTNSTVSGKKVFDLGTLEKDKWLDMVYHINFSHESDGVLEVWKNGEKVINYNGPNCYNDKSLPYFKAGIYKRRWYDVTKRVVYVDEVRVGNKNAKYYDVAPSGSTLVAQEELESNDNSKKLKLNLINANSDLFIQRLTKNSILDLASLPTKNLNISATTSENIGSVVFKLTGRENKTVIESQAPYTLFGDENGDFQSWIPAEGEYTLIATPYSGANGEGTAGTPVTIKFEVVNLSTDGSGTPKVTMVINNDETLTDSRRAILRIKAVNAAEMRFYDDSDSEWTDWEPATSIKSWTLSKGDGSKWVKVQVRNNAAVMSESYADGIILRSK
ncbi:polysaccharide lyase [Adhaeribacter radiodurans]|uniref:Heparin lyase I family protein n=1 Tax=Adhaeribacter radiodurans TaxID=2745197 RepID=A0A7L7L9U2_9BACT|nr:polysaccharide lyase [Adhaeribacter radiodurans]QMU29616.1 heparin lyase I family protein [Adhaeribacter radiodurans]